MNCSFVVAPADVDEPLPQTVAARRACVALQRGVILLAKWCIPASRTETICVSSVCESHSREKRKACFELARCVCVHRKIIRFHALRRRARLFLRMRSKIFTLRPAKWLHCALCCTSHTLIMAVRGWWLRDLP